MSSRPDLHFYQVSSKYSKGYSSYRADRKFYADANGICPKNNMSPHPPLVVVVGGEGGGGGGGVVHNDKNKDQNKGHATDVAIMTRKGFW